jgi:succinyl-diaminopimelate desuccinylase
MTTCGRPISLVDDRRSAGRSSAAWVCALVAAAVGQAAPAGASCDPARVSATAWEHYTSSGAPHLLPWLGEVVAFPTVAGDEAAWRDQARWLEARAGELGLGFRDEGTVLELELAAPGGAPVLGLVVHGDVVPADASAWSFPPFEISVRDGFVQGRGVVDDKGPLVQALLAMHALDATGAPLTHTLRLLVGSDEESGGNDMQVYRQRRPTPDIGLVLDSEFPVVVGEKAWDLLVVSAAGGPRGETRPWRVDALEAGLGFSIVPDRADLTLAWSEGEPDWESLRVRLLARTADAGTRLELEPDGGRFRIRVLGRSAHAGMNLEGGRNALVSLARLVEGELPGGPADDLLAFARLAGSDLQGAGLGLTTEDPLWGRYGVNVAVLKPAPGGDLQLSINLRRIPPFTAAELREHLAGVVADFNRRTGASLAMEAGYLEDEPNAYAPDGKLVRRLLAAYERATGAPARPVISGGGTYAKRLPDAIAFGMWFPGRPYPGHDVDERVAEEDLHRGVRVLLEALADLACGPALEEPLQP